MLELKLDTTHKYELVLHDTAGGIDGGITLKLRTEQKNASVNLLLSPFLQGPTGEKGDTGEIGGVYSFVAGENINSTVPVVTDAQGRVIKASNLNPNHAGRVFGITVSSALAGETVNIRMLGLLESPTWTFAVGTIFLGDGIVTQTVPTAGFIQILGNAHTPTKISIDLQQPFMR